MINSISDNKDGSNAKVVFSGDKNTAAGAAGVHYPGDHMPGVRAAADVGFWAEKRHGSEVYA